MQVCLNYAKEHILPQMSLKDLFHTWFQYSTKCYHQVGPHSRRAPAMHRCSTSGMQELTQHCISVLSACFTELICTPEWEKDWLELDRDQLTEFLKCNELTVPSECHRDVSSRLHAAAEQTSTSCGSRCTGGSWRPTTPSVAAPPPDRCSPAFCRSYGPCSLGLDDASPPSFLLACDYDVLTLCRFPFMSADELNSIERSPMAEQHCKLFTPHIMNAYKYMAMPLASRVGVKEFTGA